MMNMMISRRWKMMMTLRYQKMIREHVQVTGRITSDRHQISGLHGIMVH